MGVDVEKRAERAARAMLERRDAHSRTHATRLFSGAARPVRARDAWEQRSDGLVTCTRRACPGRPPSGRRCAGPLSGSM
jgi:hypothetical protein